jgi:hypothetical protein
MRTTRYKEWDALLSASMKLTEDYDTNMFMLGWSWGTNPTNKKRSDMPTVFDEGYAAGKTAFKTALEEHLTVDTKTIRFKVDPYRSAASMAVSMTPEGGYILISMDRNAKGEAVAVYRKPLAKPKRRAKVRP